VLKNAKVAADKNHGTYVFSNDGVAIYPVAAPAEETYRIHTVVKGDSLWDIAKKYLGDGSRYPEIKALNDLKSNVIYSGWKLKIPN
jgi:LysM repeat protein